MNRITCVSVGLVLSLALGCKHEAKVQVAAPTLHVLSATNPTVDPTSSGIFQGRKVTLKAETSDWQCGICNGGVIRPEDVGKDLPARMEDGLLIVDSTQPFSQAELPSVREARRQEALKNPELHLDQLYSYSHPNSFRYEIISAEELQARTN